MKHDVIAYNSNFLIKNLFFLLGIFFSTSQLSAQCTGVYQLDWSNPATYTVSCGTVNPAGWTVKNDSCNYWSPNIFVGGLPGGPNKIVNLSIRINQSGNLTANDFAYIIYSVNGVFRRMVTIRGDTISAAVASRSDTVSVPAAGYMNVRIALKTTANNRFFEIKNGDVSGCVQLTPLPVELTFFRATAQPGHVKVEWETASELNSHCFKLFRSTNASDYEACGVLKAAGTSNFNIHYSLIDRNQFDSIVYYMLEQHDFDGKISKYGPVTVSKSITVQTIQAFPNPWNGTDLNVAIGNATNSNVQIGIYDKTGREKVKYNAHPDPQGVITIPADFLNEIGAGIYVLQVSDHETNFTTRVFVE